MCRVSFREGGQGGALAPLQKFFPPPL